MFCPKCGTDVGNYAFCFKCGFDFSTLNLLEQTIEPNDMSEVDKIEANNIQCNDDFEFSFFDGSQEQFNEIYYNLCYVEKDYRKLLEFEGYVSENHSACDYENNYGCGIPTAYLLISSYTQESGFLKCISDDGWNDGSIQNLADNLAFCLSINYFMDLFGWHIYDFLSFSYKLNSDWDRFAQLQEEYDRENNDNKKNSLRSRMKEIENNYGEAWYWEESIIAKIDLLDLNHIQPQLTRLAVKYSNVLSDLYIVILNNAIKVHNADYLQGLYPTDLQKQQIAKIIENEIIDQFRNGIRNLYVTLQKENECRRLCANINELSKTLSETSLLKKGALTLGLALLSGPLGIINGVREGYNLCETDSKITELREQLQVNFGEYLDEVQKIGDDVIESCDRLKERMKTNVTDKYLVIALNNIFQKLQDKGVEVLPLCKYLE